MRLLAIGVVLVAVLHLSSPLPQDGAPADGSKVQSSFYYMGSPGKPPRSKREVATVKISEPEVAHVRTRRSPAAVQYHYVSQPRIPQWTFIRVYQKLPDPEPEPEPEPLPPLPAMEERRHLSTEESHSRHDHEEHEEEHEFHETVHHLMEHELAGRGLAHKAARRRPHTRVGARPAAVRKMVHGAPHPAAAHPAGPALAKMAPGPGVLAPGPLVHGPGPLVHGPGPLVHGPGPYTDGLGPYIHGLGPYKHGLGPFKHGLGPYIHGLGPYKHGLGPYKHGLGPYKHGLGPYIHGLGPYKHGLGPYKHGLGPYIHGVGPYKHGLGPYKHAPDHHMLLPGVYKHAPGHPLLVPGPSVHGPGDHLLIPGAHMLGPGPHMHGPGLYKHKHPYTIKKLKIGKYPTSHKYLKSYVPGAHHLHPLSLTPVHPLVAHPPAPTTYYDKKGLLHMLIETSDQERLDLLQSGVDQLGKPKWCVLVDGKHGHPSYLQVGPGHGYLNFLPVKGDGGHVDWVYVAKDGHGVTHDIHFKNAGGHLPLILASSYPGQETKGAIGYDDGGEIIIPLHYEHGQLVVEDVVHSIVAI